MRIRVVRQLTGSVDGIHLDRFRPGLVYQMGTIMATYFLAEGAAEIAEPHEEAFILPPDKHLFGPLPDDPPPVKPKPADPEPIRIAAIERHHAAERPLRRPRRG